MTRLMRAVLLVDPQRKRGEGLRYQKCYLISAQTPISDTFPKNQFAHFWSVLENQLGCGCLSFREPAHETNHRACPAN